MKKFKKGFYRISLLLLTLLMVVNVFAIMPLTANAAKVTKTQKSYEIAIVFDNSGSMYENQGKSWCRAKYAMEIFASMLNYDNGDKLWIYPMWEVTNGKPQNGDIGSYKAIPITKKEDIDKITNLYTTRPYGTPLAPVYEAHEYMKTSKATEKWILVLTDGEFNSEQRDGGSSVIDAATLKNKLISVATDGIKVQYLGFGQASALTADESKNFYAKKSTDTSLKDDLIEICNSIFQRAALPANRLSGNTLNIEDLSMSNLIVFAQGTNAKISSMTNPSGKDVKITLDSGQRKFSTIKAATYEDAGIDNTLAGQVVSFDESEAGKYTLNYSGADKVEIFYEPNVKLKVEFKDASGKVVDGSKGEIEAGEYTVTSTIIDGVTEKDVTKNELLGNVSIKTYVKTSKDKDYKEYANNAKINLTPDSGTDVYVEATYLKDFTLSSRDNEELDWLTGLKVGAQTLKFVAKATVQQDGSWYKISDHENWKPIRVDFTIEGKPLTAEQMAKLTFPVDGKGNNGLSYRYEKLPNESACIIYVGQDKNGKYVEPETGTYILKDQASYVDEYGTTHTTDASAMFDVQTYDKFWRWLFWILIILALILLWLFFMTRKVLPKNIVLDSGEVSIGVGKKLDKKFVKLNYNRKGGSLSIGTTNAVPADKKCSATFDLKAVDNRFVKSKDRKISIVGINSNCKSVEINGTEYLKHKRGVWVKDVDLDADSPKPFNKDVRNPSFTLNKGATLNCKVKNSK